jgi:FkbM family methyltransferase
MLKQALKTMVQAMLAPFGVKLQRIGSPTARCTMEAAFRALRARKHAFRTVIDIGASNGSWSDLLMRHFPECQYFLVEAQPVHEPALRDYCAHHRNAQYVLAAAGERAGKIFFDVDDPFGGQASSTRSSPDQAVLPVVTIDAEVATRKLSGPYLLKFDTHGFELPILKGAVDTLAKTDVIVMECYNFRISPQCLTFPEMCAYLGERGFRCIDLVDPLHRPHDDSFWQMDLVFVRDNRPEFSYPSYR